jgi:hypothetical protein
VRDRQCGASSCALLLMGMKGSEAFGQISLRAIWAVGVMGAIYREYT